LSTHQAFDEQQDQLDMMRLVAGCDEAIEGLMQRHAKRLVSQLMRILRDKAEAQECLLEAFVRVYQDRHAFHLEAKFSRWLNTISFSLARDRLRRRASRPEFVSLEAPNTQEVGDLEEILLDPDRPPDQAMENRERSRSLSEAVAGLPDTLRRSLVLFAEDGKSHQEIAAEMQCTIKAVEMRLCHARKHLHFILERKFIGHEGSCSPKRNKYEV
jgi:RNA polymerase sigma-70 factor (ECF subfamily)